MKIHGLLPPHPHKKFQMRKEGEYNIRLWFTPFNKKTKKCAYLRLKCGCCDKGVQIYISPDAMEINGVNGSFKQWKEIFNKIFKVCKVKHDEDIKW